MRSAPTGVLGERAARPAVAPALLNTRHMVTALQLFDDATLSALRGSLAFATARHQAIASNIANVNTPGYRRVDVAAGFEAAFRDAVQQRGPTPEPKFLEDTTAAAVRADGNNVNLDRELYLLAENNTRHEFAAEVLRRRFSGLRTAITGRAS